MCPKVCCEKYHSKYMVAYYKTPVKKFLIKKKRWFINKCNIKQNIIL